MKLQRFTFLIVVLSAAMVPAMGEIDIPSDGSDGAFSPTSDLEIDLNQAVTGQWDMNNAANAGKGIYDPGKWAIVFKYTDVTIPEGVTVTFTNHSSRAPVVWLVSGNVTIAGELNLDGKALDAGVGFMEPEGGPGGFRGGALDSSTGATGSGFGPGGSVGNGGAYASSPRSDSATYGNSKIVPLIGGSGGAAWNFGGTRAGGGGGGAILIGARADVTINGTISARGGNPQWRAAAGAGGAMRIIADRLFGNGILTAQFRDNHRDGGQGRVRVEARQYSASLTTVPGASLESPGESPQLWPESDAPTATIVSIAGESVPPDPRASMELPGADTTIATGDPVPVIVQTTNMPSDSTVSIRIGGRYTNSFTVQATHESGNETVSTWSADVTFPLSYSSIRVVATGP